MSTGTPQRAEANLAAVGEIYAAFGRGDVPATLASSPRTAPGESWAQNTAQDAGISHLQPRRGRDGVAEFFADGGRFGIHSFEVLDMFAGGDKVAVEVSIDATSPGGGRLRDEELHLYTLDDSGRVTRMRHYIDMAKHIAADGGDDTTRA